MLFSAFGPLRNETLVRQDADNHSQDSRPLVTIPNIPVYFPGADTLPLRVTATLMGLLGVALLLVARPKTSESVRQCACAFSATPQIVVQVDVQVNPSTVVTATGGAIKDDDRTEFRASKS